MPSKYSTFTWYNTFTQKGPEIPIIPMCHHEVQPRQATLTKASINRIYGFYDECKRRYSIRSRPFECCCWFNFWVMVVDLYLFLISLSYMCVYIHMHMYVCIYIYSVLAEKGNVFAPEQNNNFLLFQVSKYLLGCSRKFASKLQGRWHGRLWKTFTDCFNCLPVSAAREPREPEIVQLGFHSHGGTP